jgi:hypothetical protein
MSQPAHRIRSGILQVTIWRNSGDKGNWYSVVPTRSYKQGDAWKETSLYCGSKHVGCVDCGYWR